MDALNLLTTRRSSKKLTAPAPNAEQLEQMLQAATQVPDHGNMRPYRFTVIQSEAGLERFRGLLSKTVTELNFGDDAMKKAERVGNMAPMIIGVTFVPNREVAKTQTRMGANADRRMRRLRIATGRISPGLRQCLDYRHVGQQPIVARSV